MQKVFERTSGQLMLVEGAADEGLLMSLDVPVLLARLGVMRPLIVSGGGLARSGIIEEMTRRGMPYVHFSGFTPNPSADEVAEGLALLRAEGCDGILSIGGGSAIDVAKGIKALAGTDASLSLLERLTQPCPAAFPHVAMPTTAGTGSEATHFATIYIDGVKYSVAHAALLPEVAILDASALASLSAYQRASTYMDALCHSVESFWAMRANEESRAYAKAAIGLLLDNGARYLAGDQKVAGAVLAAANLAGCAINITKTTAAHAMCYQLTALYGLSHGHAAAVCLPAAWQVLLKRAENDDALAQTMATLAELMTNRMQAAPAEGLLAYQDMLALAALPTSWQPESEADMARLVTSVNVERLSNFPVPLTAEDLTQMYQQALRQAI